MLIYLNALYSSSNNANVFNTFDLPTLLTFKNNPDYSNVSS
ncbi:MAG: hypothetical protein CM15mP11_03140 [Gammaproteobacteria bacterium]|nr:MAG: hypothetical protein CM15mP11_03140 [Gammaproteobacteria bacterium]